MSVAVEDRYARLVQLYEAAGGETVELDESWRAVDLAPIAASGYAAPTPELLRTRDGLVGYLYRRCVNMLYGDSGTGKSWIALHAVAQVIRAGRRAIVVDFEANAGETFERLRALGLSAQQILGQLVYVAPNAPTSDAAVDHVLGLIGPDVDLVVIDSLGEAFGLDGIDENADADVGPWLRRVARQLAEAGPAVLLIDHSTKAADNPLHPSGSKRKRAAVTGASYQVKALRAPTREQAGTLLLVCSKDRHGHHARGQVVATVDVEPYPDGGVSVHLHRPSSAEAQHDGGTDAVARAAVRILRDAGEPLTKNALLALMADKVRARREVKLGAIDIAITRGAIARADGPRGAQILSYASAFGSDDEQ